MDGRLWRDEVLTDMANRRHGSTRYGVWPRCHPGAPGTARPASLVPSRPARALA
jgi:hypothetical protein